MKWKMSRSFLLLFILGCPHKRWGRYVRAIQNKDTEKRTAMLLFIHWRRRKYLLIFFCVTGVSWMNPALLWSGRLSGGLQAVLKHTECQTMMAASFSLTSFLFVQWPDQRYAPAPFSGHCWTNIKKKVREKTRNSSFILWTVHGQCICSFLVAVVKFKDWRVAHEFLAPFLSQRIGRQRTESRSRPFLCVPGKVSGEAWGRVSAGQE